MSGASAYMPLPLLLLSSGEAWVRGDVAYLKIKHRRNVSDHA